MKLPDVPIKETVEFDLQRKVAAHKTFEAWENVPHAGIILELDVSEVLSFVKKVQKKPEYADLKVTINTIMMKIVAESFKEAPELNSFVEYKKKSNSGRVYIMEDINIAMPLILRDGRTITPVMSQVGKKTIKEICLAMIDLQRRIKNTNTDFLLFEAGMKDTVDKLKRGRIGVFRRIFKNLFGKNKLKIDRKEFKEYLKIPEEDRITADNLLSATMLISNIGPAFKGLSCYIGLLEIIPPQMTVIGLASIRKKPVAVKGKDGKYQMEIRDVLPASIYCDHRGMDFAPAVPALRKMTEMCKNPEEFLKEWL